MCLDIIAILGICFSFCTSSHYHVLKNLMHGKMTKFLHQIIQILPLKTQTYLELTKYTIKNIKNNI